MPLTSAKDFPEGLTAELLQALADTADRGRIGLSVVAVDVDPPEFLFINDCIADTLGYTVSEFVEIPTWELFTKESAVALQERLTRNFEGPGDENRFEVWLVKKGGEKIPLELTTRRVTLGGRPTHVSFTRDVSLQVKATRALAASEERFRLAVESAPDGVVILRGPSIVYANRRAAVLLGHAEPESVQGRFITDFLHPEDAVRARDRIMELVRSGKPFSEPGEYRARGIDGRENNVEISSVAIEFEGKPAVLGFARDVTERKAMQEKMVQADRLAAVGTLAAGIAHEINNPLAYVLLGLQYLERELPKLPLEGTQLSDALERLGEIRNGAERVGTIVRDLKTFARADDVARGPVDIRGVVEAALKIADNEIRHRATLVRDYELTPFVHGNAARLEQVFLNLLVNAAHALVDRVPYDSEVRVVIRAESPSEVIVEIIDNGAGIPPHLIYRVFDPFFTTKPVGVGTGLGLPICRSIVESFGGDVELVSELGMQTIARVRLVAHVPSDTRDASVEVENKPSRPPDGRTRLLVVDDEPLVGSLLRRMLSSHHDVVVATTGHEALESIDSNAYDAILCDVMMPGMTGMDLYARLRARGDDIASRMVFMTGGAFVPKVAEFLSSIENPKLEKPFDLVALTKAIRRIVGP